MGGGCCCSCICSEFSDASFLSLFTGGGGSSASGSRATGLTTSGANGGDNSGLGLPASLAGGGDGAVEAALLSNEAGKEAACAVAAGPGPPRSVLYAAAAVAPLAAAADAAAPGAARLAPESRLPLPHGALLPLPHPAAMLPLPAVPPSAGGAALTLPEPAAPPPTRRSEGACFRLLALAPFGPGVLPAAAAASASASSTAASGSGATFAVCMVERVGEYGVGCRLIPADSMYGKACERFKA